MAHTCVATLYRRRSLAITRPAVFLDRDGVIIENRDDYVKAWPEVRFLPGALQALHRLARSEYAVAIVTNQSVVGRGVISPDQAIDIHRRLTDEIGANGGRVDASYFCFHRPGDACSCRKPAPGMFLRAACDLDLDLTQSYAVGDAITDMEAAEAAGAHGILVLTGRGRAQSFSIQADLVKTRLVKSDLSAAVEYILGRKGGTA